MFINSNYQNNYLINEIVIKFFIYIFKNCIRENENKSLSLDNPFYVSL